MTFKKIFSSFIISGVLLSSLYAGQVTAQNNTSMTISVTIRGVENDSGKTPFTLIQHIRPGKHITVQLEESDFEKGVTFSVQGTTVTAPGVPVLSSNESILTSCYYKDAKVVFTSKSDGSGLACAVTQ